MRQISQAGLLELIAADPALPVVDVRTPVEFAEVHVSQSRNIPLDQLNPGKAGATLPLRPDQPVYLLCRSGQRAARAAEILARHGFAAPTIVEGGMLAWIEAGYPVTRGKSKVISLERQVRIAAGLLVLGGLGLGWFVHPGFLGLSAFTGAGLVFAGITDFCGMGLLLARAPWNRQA